MEVVEWVDRMRWSCYNAHFLCEDVRNGIYDKFEAIQGQNNTYYTGELLAGNANGKVLDYSYDLINRFWKKL
jgi:hypothetical protein